MKKMNNKAWIRIAEAFLAILIVIGVLLVIMSKQDTTTNISEVIYERQDQILDLISENNTLREDIIIGDNIEVNNLIVKMVPSSWEFETKICEIDDICSMESSIYDRDVYAEERLITSTLTQYSPKKLRFFVWMK